MSLVDGNGLTGLFTNLLRCVKSVTTRTRPSDLGTKKPGLHQSVTSETLARTPLLIRSWIVFSAGSSYLLGTHLAARTFRVFEFSLRLMVIGVGVSLGLG